MTDDSNEREAAFVLLGDERTTAVSIAGALTGAASADHVGGDMLPFVSTLTVGHRVQPSLHQGVGRPPIPAQPSPARDDGLLTPLHTVCLFAWD